jgi:hypothetical protein
VTASRCTLNGKTNAVAVKRLAHGTDGILVFGARLA